MVPLSLCFRRHLLIFCCYYAVLSVLVCDLALSFTMTPFLSAGSRVSSRSSRYVRLFGAAESAGSGSDGDGGGGGGGEEGGKGAKRMPSVLSGVQPTGSMHLGNYLGAVRQWVPLQDTHSCNFCVVDLHAITGTGDLKERQANLEDWTLSSAAVYMACGVDPKKSNIFVQSHVPAHTELSWLLTCSCPLGWMERMIQFKEKSKGDRSAVGLGLFSYPVLMASDILLYGADMVPVGEDQVSKRMNVVWGVGGCTGV